MKSIVLDIDGVVANTIDVLKKSIEKRGKRAVFSQYHPIIEGVDDTEDFIYNIVESILLGNEEIIEPYNDALRFVPLIVKYIGNLTFLTARNMRHYNATLQWLIKHFPVDFELEFRHSWKKADFLCKNDVDLFVEDRLRTANHAAESGIKTFLINREWNIGRLSHIDVTRINSLEEFYLLNGGDKIDGN